MNVLFDTSVWIDHLRKGTLTEPFIKMRGRFRPVIDAVVVAELEAGCRSDVERRVVDALVRPFRRAGRIELPNNRDYDRAARALSRLRERGRQLKGASSALLDALIAAVASRVGALVVTQNVADFGALATQIPISTESWDQFRTRLFA